MTEDGSTAAGGSAAAVLSVPHDGHSPVFTCVVGHAALRGCGVLHVSMLCDALPDPQRVFVAPPHQLRPQRSRAIRHRIFIATGRVGEPTKPGGAVRWRHASSCCCWAAACSGCLRYADHRSCTCQHSTRPALADTTCAAGVAGLGLQCRGVCSPGDAAATTSSVRTPVGVMTCPMHPSPTHCRLHPTSGHGSTDDVLTPTPVAALAGKVAVHSAAGFTQSFCIVAGGGLFAWGSGAAGQLGLGEGTCVAPLPTAVVTCAAFETGDAAATATLSPMPPVASVECGECHSIAISARGATFTVSELAGPHVKSHVGAT